MDRLEAMSLFVRVAERGSFAAAAEQLGVARSVVTRPDIETPGVLVQWEEGSRGDQQRRTVWQLMLPGKGGEIVNVVGYAPTSDFVTSRVPTVLGTVRLTS